jgi:hypothetical protein
MTGTLFDAPTPRKKGVGVSRLVDDIINPGERMLQWAWRRGRDGEPLRDEARRKGGIQVHKLAELLVQGGRPQPESVLNEPERNATVALLEWWDHVKPQNGIAELRLDDGTFHGIIDLVFQCRGCNVCRHRWRCRGCRTTHTSDDWVAVTSEGHPSPTRMCPHIDKSHEDGNLAIPDPGYWIADYKAVESGAWFKEKWHFQSGAAYRRLWDWHADLHGLAPSCGALVVKLHTDTAESETIPSACTPDMAQHAADWHADLQKIRDAITLQRA